MIFVLDQFISEKRYIDTAYMHILLYFDWNKRDDEE